MFKRLIRAIRGLFGGVISSIEDPKLILEQNIRELNNQVPRMNENIATLKANVAVLQRSYNQFAKDHQTIYDKIKTAIEANREDIAEKYAIHIQRLEQQIQGTKEQLLLAKESLQKGLQIKDVFMAERERKIRSAKEAMRANERAKWQNKIANTLEQFEQVNIDQTHDEMVVKLYEEAAKSEARMDLAIEGLSSRQLETEINTEKLQAQQFVKNIKKEMASDKAPIQLHNNEQAKVKLEEKTIGKQQRTSS